MSKLWDKGYDLDKQIEAFTVGNDFIIDQELVSYDCIASKVHAEVLHRADLLTFEEAEAIKKVLDEIIELQAQGRFEISREQEDGHTAIEAYLCEKLGDVGKKIHTGRSRNDQVLTALRLFYKSKLGEMSQLKSELVQAIKEFVSSYGGIAYPGYTHMQKAMPSSFALWGESFIDSMEDNGSMLSSVLNLIDQSPLGTGAGYGIPLQLDREYAADQLGFARVQENPIYTQHSRGKFEIFLVQVLSQFTHDLNKLASDLILFNMQEFAFVGLPDEFCTGSSIMPQKKNPDVLELLRAKHHQITTAQFEISNISSNLISGYNRDIQLTKEPVIRAFKTSIESMQIAILLFKKLVVNKDKCQNAMIDELYATEQAYQLVKSGVPFREAYRQVAEKLKGK